MAVTDSFVQSVQALTEALRASMGDPADQVRLLSSLANFTVQPLPAGLSTINTAIQTAKLATAAACRRAVLTSLARACADYQPQSVNDVNAVLTAVVPLFDAEILYAADNGELETYSALRILRSAVVTDLKTRGASLPSLITVGLNTSLPITDIAYALYADSTRANQLLQMNPTIVHPLFVPSGIQALSS